MTRLLSLDLHAHIDPQISPADLLDLRAVVFAATRSLDEAEPVLERRDARTVWGVGCHPALAQSHAGFEVSRFARLIDRTAFVSEIGLDGRSGVPMEQQRATLRAVFSILQTTPRVASIHSYAATHAVLEELESHPIKGAILHWWLGDQEQTQRAVEMGCFFSVNAAMIQKKANVEHIPINRLFTETDHPFGDKRSGINARPGALGTVETALASHFGMSVPSLRLAVWSNLQSLINDIDCAKLMPGGVRTQLAAL
jgi:TatD DNase family protein